MYLELSERQSGRTTRLIETVVRKYKRIQEDNDLKGWHIVIVCKHVLCVLDLLNKCGVFPLDILTVINGDRPLLQHMRGRDDTKTLLFVDDFDVCLGFKKEIDKLLQNHLPMIQNGYFASTKEENSVAHKLLLFV